MGKKRYTPAPAVAPEMAERLDSILEVLAGKTTVAQAARELGMSRNHFQTLLHRGLAGLTESITPKPGGRPAKPEHATALEEENQRLQREIGRLRQQADTTERLLQAASGLLQGRIRPARQSRQRKTAAGADEEADSESHGRLWAIEQMRRCGFTAQQAARVAGVHPATARRWRAQVKRGLPCARRDRQQRLDPQASHEVELRVRALHGLIGAEALRRRVPGVSRRQAARLKASTLQAMERERKADLTRVCVTAPGVVRGMDAMHLRTCEGRAYALFTADAAIPYRTGVTVTTRYDARAVERALRSDIQRHGAPLVYRFDRAKAHQTQGVRALLQAHGVVALQGPPHCARYYGQHERQNREHRAWAADIGALRIDQLQPYFEDAIVAINEQWPRRALRWQTARQAWDSRSPLAIDRAQWLREVNERVAYIKRNLQLRGNPADLAQRLAIERALQSRGLLRLTNGGWC